MSSSERARYRFRQLRRSLRPNVRAGDLNTARRVLGEHLFPLFDSMQAADQLHCLDVYQRLVAGGCTGKREPENSVGQPSRQHPADRAKASDGNTGHGHDKISKPRCLLAHWGASCGRLTHSFL